MKNIKLEKKYNLVLFLCLLSLITLASKPLLAQSKAEVYNYDYSIGLAFTTSKILGDNPAISTIAPFGSPDVGSSVVGGSFNGAMPGVELKAQYKLDDIGDWRLVGGVNYSFYSARERIPTGNVTNRLTHNLNILSPLLGINYTVFRFPLAMSSVYAGVELRYNYIHQTNFKHIIENEINGESTLRSEYSKGNTGRFGSLIKLGLEGELYENYMINVSWGYDMLNLIGRDETRGQLLTPFKSNVLAYNKESEMNEQLTNNFYFSLMIQYRF